MKLSHQWLREWVAPRLDPLALAERLTLAGLEVGAIEPVAPPLTGVGVVVGKVLTKSPHPTAGQLTLCKVEVGPRKTVNVVCGAPNVVVGMKAPLALAGAILPDGRRIEATVVQGIESQGMLCSAAELGLGDDAAGLLIIDSSVRTGTSLHEALQLDDVTFEIDLTPNRGDCLSVAGIAREVAALTGVRLRAPSKRKSAVKTSRRVAVKLSARAECPRYAGRVVQQLNPSATTPLWMRERLRRAGVRTVHPFVDVTNYVMLELGQPMHAFDLEKLRGTIRVRVAGANEALTLLDGKSLTAPVGSLLIADERGPIALAGIMGGAATAVGDRTHSVFLESACFDPSTIARHARALGIQTDASQRFERGVDPQLQRQALERATELLVAIAGGKPGPITQAQGKRGKTAAILLRRDRLARVIGCEFSGRDVERALKGLGMQVRKTKVGWNVSPPSYRFDVDIEADLIEEVVRVVGYASVPARLPTMSLAGSEHSESKLDVKRVRALLVDRDYQEVITYSFVDPELQRLIDPTHAPLALANPISTDMAVMRTTLWPGLLQTLRYNRNRQQARVRLFEIGRRFLPSVNDVSEEEVIGGVASGLAADEQWGLSKRDVDFYDVKGDLEVLFALTGYSERFRFVAAIHPALHPGQSAAIHVGEEQVGWIGTLHPALQTRFEVGNALLFELRLAALAGKRVPAFGEISRFPSIRRDISIVVREDTAAQQVIDAIRKVAGNLLAKLQLIDLYRGEGIDSGRKSLTLGLTLQDSSRTLREAEADALMTQVISTLASEMGAELRR